MEERLTLEDENLLMSSIRTGRPLAPQRREAFVVNTKALLGYAKSYSETCHLLADACLSEIARYDDSIGPEWKQGVMEEIQWWWTWINTLRRQNKLQSWAHLRAQPFPFEADCAKLADKELRCLNIGCGPRPNLGEATAYDVEVVHMDPLASAYNRLMGFLDAPGGGDVVFGAVEIMDQLETGKFHFIAAKNCLDHAYDVPSGLRQMIDVLEDRGVIALEHYENEAEAENYLGFHKWNIEMKDGKIHVWSRDHSELFDHEAYGFQLSCETTIHTKVGGQPHPMLHIRLMRGLG
ncbi:MAG: methyltransferase domain-containing protein [Silicimonas sp.]|nr:methyltransferase domain-containing protein [Silicimonas sp.]